MMVVPLVVLAIGADAGRPARHPGRRCSTTPSGTCSAHWLEPVLGPELARPARRSRSGSWSRSTLLAAGRHRAWRTCSTAAATASRRAGSRRAFPGFVRLVQDKFRVDELYDALIIRPIRALSRGLYRVRRPRSSSTRSWSTASALVVDVFARIARAVQDGDVQRYMAVFAIGVARAGRRSRRSRPLPFTKLKVTQIGAAPSRSTPAGAPARSDAPARIRVRLRRRAPGRQGPDRRAARHDYERARQLHDPRHRHATRAGAPKTASSRRVEVK